MSNHGCGLTDFECQYLAGRRAKNKYEQVNNLPHGNKEHKSGTHLTRPGAKRLHITSGPDVSLALSCRVLCPPSLGNATPPISHMHDSLVFILLARVGHGDQPVGRSRQEDLVKRQRAERQSRDIIRVC